MRTDQLFLEKQSGNFQLQDKFPQNYKNKNNAHVLEM